MITYEIIRSRRKTLALQITPQGKVVVRAPLRCPKAYIEQFVRSKNQWICSHLEQAQKYLAEQEQFRPCTMKTMMFCGKQLQVIPAASLGLDLEKDIIYLPDKTVPELLPELRRCYQDAAYPWLMERMEHWAKVMGISYQEVRFSAALRRWGSCSADGIIRISWMLMMAPASAIDYVLVHELAHRRVFNHSAAFWREVECYLPDYQAQKKVLLELSQKLYGQGWSKKYTQKKV